MDHVVFFPAHDGSPAFRRVASLEDAVRLVEHLRNSEGIDHVSVHALTEVPLAFKAYYRVEVPGGPVPEVPADLGLPAAVPVVEPDHAAAPVQLAPEGEAAAVEAEQSAEAPVEQDVEALVPEQEAADEQVPVPSSLGFFAS